MFDDTKQEQEREEIHRSVWAIADELRGAVDGWDFKNYVLGAMFYRYISENLTKYINDNEHESGDKFFDYEKIYHDQAEEIREGIIDEKGFFIYPEDLFINVCKRASTDDNLNMTLEKIFKNIEESSQGTPYENSFKGLFADFNVNSNKLGGTVAKRNQRICKLLEGIRKMDLGSFESKNADSIGDAYEYLMSMYASNAGKSGGEFFTPAEVSELLTRLGTVGKTSIRNVYDPACGSGSLLLKAIKILHEDSKNIDFYGQEINLTTYNLCRINMFLHNLNPSQFHIACDDTLVNPHFRDKQFELVVSNPPYSIKWVGDSNTLLINDSRFSPAGVLAPKGKADLAFVMHSLAYLAPNGTAAVVCFPGIMYRGGAEQKIRQYLIDNNFVDCVIQLPDNLFYGTSIATCIMVMKRGKTDNKILFIDATNECVKVTNNNRLSKENIDNIINVFTTREDKEHFSKLVSYDEIKSQDYNLSVGTYVSVDDQRERVNIEQLNDEIRQVVQKQQELRDAIDQIIAEITA